VRPDSLKDLQLLWVAHARRMTRRVQIACCQSQTLICEMVHCLGIVVVSKTAERVPVLAIEAGHAQLEPLGPTSRHSAATWACHWVLSVGPKVIT
jgi:hypothetical protein